MWMEKSAWKSLVMMSPVNGRSSRQPSEVRLVEMNVQIVCLLYELLKASSYPRAGIAFVKFL